MKMFIQNLKIVGYSALLTILFAVIMANFFDTFIFYYYLPEVIRYIAVCALIALACLCIIDFFVQLFKWSKRIRYWLMMGFTTLFFTPWFIVFEFSFVGNHFIISYIITLSVITYFHWTELRNSKTSTE